jgi:hypothetical protein
MERLAQKLMFTVRKVTRSFIYRVHRFPRSSEKMIYYNICEEFKHRMILSIK